MFEELIEQLLSEWERASEIGYSKNMFIMSILSDAQEEISLGRTEEANRKINAAKIALDKI